ncbi:AraC family transcriptional regulator [Psychroserpens luteolus]|uniref:AraC family transcriptional regulator n=1 Tax=Psychroserpens luteolus TaxID=2855840 RepID=UPI001E4EA1C0|nr:helix-turn-helix domain-containing protein [Psychroserpens luteolus]MCD2260073.1 helix-turn-helix domain-containing protein [Psychroserpens luteolus]
MKFYKYKASKSLEHLIAYFWTLKSSHKDAFNVSYRFVPDAYVDWVFHLGVPWQCHFPDISSQSQTGQFHVFGQIKKYVDLLLPNGELDVFGVKFHPWVANKIWKIDMHYLTNSCLNLNDLDLPKIEELQERVFLAQNVKDRIRIVENYLEPYISYNDKQSLKTVVRTIDIHTQSLESSIQYFGQRRLQQRFKNEMGISPKLFMRTMRINNVIEQMKVNPKLSLTQLTYEYNYFDQNHFIKDFRLFTGYNPTAFLKSIKPDGDILNLRASG